MVREAAMPSLTIRDIPEDLHEKLKADAAAQGRSLNKEILIRLRLSTEPRKPPVDELLRRARENRERMPGVWITNEVINRAKRRGRA
ncbi:MAG TPA: Arc family DNA-binding protein [Thermoanaerobaculia bacterium]|jgi:plasmid stability protein|nr:Arc family DNA-binding protein [Thermoanaerobaculia bacterium]HPA52707.1 Arc family DNA-binding protein [Thermoanaerobaculia bacterium]